MSVTVHSLVANEDQFIWFSLMSVLPYVDQVFLYDTGSTDKTCEIIKSIKSEKIMFEQKGKVGPEKISILRQEMIDRTKTDFFLIVDGDEIWPKSSLSTLLKDMNYLPKEKIALYCRTRNAVGDIYHYLPESTGKYQFEGKIGNFNMRAFRNLPGLAVTGIYPLEAYTYLGKPLNNWNDKLYFSDVWYLHATHLKRSSSNIKIIGFRAEKIEKGIPLSKLEIPEVFTNHLPLPRSYLFELTAMLLTPFKSIKRSLERTK